MAVDSVIRVSFEGRLGYGDLAVTTFHWRVKETDQPDLQGEMTQLLGVIEDDLVPVFLGTFNTSCVLDRLVARTVEGPPQGTELLIGLTGSRSGDALPQQLSGQILYRSLLLGRRYSGKQKLWPPTETDIAAATWTAAYITVMSNWAIAITTDLVNVGCVFGPTIFSKKFSFDNLVTGYRVTQDPRTQRTRTIGFGG